MRILKYAIKNIIRNKFLSLSSIGVIALIAFFINVLLLVNFATHTMIDKVNARISFSISLKSSYDNKNSEVIELLSNLKAMDASLDIQYISADDALQILRKRDPELVKVIENDSENPLPSSILIKNIALDQYSAIDSVIKKYKNIIVYDEQKSKKSIIDYQAQYEKITSFTQVLQGIVFGIYTIIGLFIFTVFLVVYSIIGNFVFYYRDEIKITELVGGDNVYVYGPFSLQGSLYTLIAGIISLTLFTYLLWNIPYALFDDSKLIMMFFTANQQNFLIELIGLGFIGFFSGFLSSSRFIGQSSSEV